MDERLAPGNSVLVVKKGGDGTFSRRNSAETGGTLPTDFHRSHVLDKLPGFGGVLATSENGEGIYVDEGVMLIAVRYRGGAEVHSRGLQLFECPRSGGAHRDAGVQQ